MKNLLRTFACLAFSIHVSESFSQSSCESVYANSTKNTDLVIKKSLELSSAYSKHCETNGSLRASSSAQNLSIAYAGIELGWKGTAAEATQAMQNFCRQQRSQYYNANSFNSYTSTIVTEALNSFNQCKLLEGKSLLMSHVADTQAVVIRGDFNPTTTFVEVQAIRFDSKLGKCYSTSIKPPNPINIDEKTQAFVPKSTFTIICERQEEKDNNDTSRFPRFEVAVATNIGTYPVTLLNEEVSAMDLASENKRLLARQSAIRTALTNQLSEEKKKSAHLQIRIDNVTVVPKIVTLPCTEAFSGSCDAPSVMAPNPVFTETKVSGLAGLGSICLEKKWAYSCITVPK
jgi:hypothetical protein